MNDRPPPEHSRIPLRIAQIIDDICLNFERSCQSGRGNTLEDVLQDERIPAEYAPRLFEELLPLELHRLRQARIFPSRFGFEQRFRQFPEEIRRIFSQYSALADRRQFEETRLLPAGLSTTSSADIPGQIGRYQVEQELGRGSFGVVYLATDPHMYCQVAIKQMAIRSVAEKMGLGSQDTARVVDHVLSEARLAVKFRQQRGIVPMLDVLVVSNNDIVSDIYFVQDYIHGNDLKAELKQSGGTLPPEQTAETLRQVASSIARVHVEGVYHRDLKPGNILLDQQKHPFIADFGLAIDTALQAGLRGQFAGTLHYMAPEQIRCEVNLLDGRSDIWALGVILYEMLTGRLPFAHTDHREIPRLILDHEPVPLRDINRHAPVELERICLKCLSKRMNDRYADADELHRDLTLWLTNGDTTPTRLESQLIPKGLRAFDDGDAGFFLRLLPGPRERNGLTAQLSFWKNLIEEHVPERCARIGLIYGPSGSGKSSFVKAGLVPRLKRVESVYVESTANDTEVRILAGLRNIAPDLTDGLSLPQAIAALRDQPRLSGFRKVLLIVDQFEQWLQSRRQFGGEQLIAALRQVDGVHVQVLLLVRDDFWMAVTRFLNEVQVQLVPGENVAPLDQFSLAHAQKVLEEFGRAYGRLPADDALTPSQTEFIRKAVDGISEDDTVVCVRLVVFAELVKDRAWQPDTIDDIGGTDGVGERFLEMAFSDRAASPRHRAYESVARRLLKELLPPTGTDIKGHMQSRAALIQASEASDLAEFEDVLQVLDGELRLITPTDPDSTGNSGASHGSSYYQLAHDFLVPSLRNWLNRRLAETSRGRAELKLAERSRNWRMRRESKQLPSWREWLSIRFLIPSRHWNRDESRMMTAADRHHGIRSTVVVLVAASLLVSSLWWSQERQWAAASALVRRIEDSEPYEVLAMQTEMLGVHSALREQLSTRLAGHTDDPSAQTVLRLALLLMDDERQVEPLLALMLSAPASEVEALAEALQPWADRVQDRLFTLISNAEKSPARRVRAAAACGTLRPDNAAWNSTVAAEAVELMTFDTIENARVWGRMLQPVSALNPPLQRAFLRWRSKPPGTSVAAALSEYLNEAPDDICSLLEKADDDQCRILAHGLVTTRDSALPVLRARKPQQLDAQANLILAQLILGDSERFWEHLAMRPDPTLRTTLIHRWQSTQVPPRMLVDRLNRERDPTRLQALIHIIHLQPEHTWTERVREQLTTALRRLFDTHEHAGVHSSSGLVLKHWGAAPVTPNPNIPSDSATGSPSLANAGRIVPRWSNGPNRHTMVIIPRPVAFAMRLEQPDGIPVPVHRHIIPRSFAIASCETTNAQFNRVIEDYLGESTVLNAADRPVSNLRWELMAEYCNQLSEQDGLDVDQFCYERVDDVLVPAADFLDRRGYRLPTEAEWAFCSGGGADTAHFIGDVPSHLGDYAWFEINAPQDGPRTAAVGSKLPNGFGIFDVYGNVWEYCQSGFHVPPSHPESPTLDNSARQLIPGPNVMRGACSRNPLPQLNSAYRVPCQPGRPQDSIGFRIARTLHGPIDVTD